MDFLKEKKSDWISSCEKLLTKEIFSKLMNEVRQKFQNSTSRAQAVSSLKRYKKIKTILL